jgi:GTP-binding protein YchF
MKLGLVGFPQVGKRSLFRLLTGQPVHDAGRENRLGLAPVRDPRFDRLGAMYQPQKHTPAQVEFVLFPDLELEAARNGEILKELDRVDAICHLVRFFEDDTVFHIDGSVGPGRDIRRLDEELQLNDLIFVEKRLERLSKERGKKADMARIEQEIELLGRMQSHLEAGTPLADFPISDEEQRLITSYPFLTRKPVIIVLNVGEDQLADTSTLNSLQAEFAQRGFEWVVVSARIEEELAELEAEERAVFLEELGLFEPALDRLTQVCYATLGLISFFTVGKDEVRAWTIPRASLAPQAGGAIHSDIERGFIRCETMTYNDLIEHGNEQKVKDAGKLSPKGRDYEVKDGDVLHFLFKV